MKTTFVTPRTDLPSQAACQNQVFLSPIAMQTMNVLLAYLQARCGNYVTLTQCEISISGVNDADETSLQREVVLSAFYYVKGMETRNDQPYPPKVRATIRLHAKKPAETSGDSDLLWSIRQLEDICAEFEREPDHQQTHPPVVWHAVSQASESFVQYQPYGDTWKPDVPVLQ